MLKAARVERGQELRGKVISEGIPRWHRGPCELDQDRVRLVQPQVYQPRTTAIQGKPLLSVLPFALAGLRTAEDVRAFVHHYGLLAHGPDDRERTESISEFLEHAKQLDTVVRMRRVLTLAVRGDARAVRECRQVWKPRIAAISNFIRHPPTSDAELFQQMAVTIGARISAFLQQTSVQLVPAFGLDSSVASPTRYELLVLEPNLLRLAYYSLAHALLEEREVRACENPACGRIFLVDDRRQRYCGPACGNRVRVRRSRAKRTARSTKGRA